MMKKLSCHCGGVEAEVSLPTGLKNVLKCNCSICKKKGITMVNKIGLNDLKITKGEELLSFISITPNPQNTTFVQFVEFIRIINPEVIQTHIVLTQLV